MKQEPVAWVDKEIGCFVCSRYEYEDLDEHGKDGLIPLYTHPVKELTDEEILELIVNKTTDAEMIKEAIKKARGE